MDARDDPHLQETCLSSREAYRGHFLRVQRDEVRLPDGGRAIREYIAHPGAVVVVALLDNDFGRVVVERQFRYPVRRVMIEFPAGKIDPGEPPLDCARRELLEETGYIAREWARAGVMHPVIGYSDEFIEIWFARGLQQQGRRLDEGEFLDVFEASPDELLDWSRDGRLTDAKTLTALLWLQNVRGGLWGLDWRPQSAGVAPGS